MPLQLLHRAFKRGGAVFLTDTSPSATVRGNSTFQFNSAAAGATFFLLNRSVAIGGSGALTSLDLGNGTVLSNNTGRSWGADAVATNITTLQVTVLGSSTISSGGTVAAAVTLLDGAFNSTAWLAGSRV